MQLPPNITRAITALRPDLEHVEVIDGEVTFFYKGFPGDPCVRREYLEGGPTTRAFDLVDDLDLEDGKYSIE